jgi:hypothetical protein
LLSKQVFTEELRRRPVAPLTRQDTNESEETTTMSSTPSGRMTIDDFLFRRLEEVGVWHLFGVPGDFNPISGVPLVVIVLATHRGASAILIGIILGIGGVGGLLGAVLAPYLVCTIRAGIGLRCNYFTYCCQSSYGAWSIAAGSW